MTTFTTSSALEHKADTSRLQYVISRERGNLRLLIKINRRLKAENVQLKRQLEQAFCELDHAQEWIKDEHVAEQRRAEYRGATDRIHGWQIMTMARAETIIFTMALAMVVISVVLITGEV